MHRLQFFGFLLPQGVHLLLTPFLVLLKTNFYHFHTLNLVIHLFVNMMASHNLIKTSSEFAWTMLSMGCIMYLAQLAPLWHK
jgi:hypothetical protein